MLPVVVALLLVAAGAAVYAAWTGQQARRSDDHRVTVQRLERAAGALVEFAQRSRRLPCPAAPAAMAEGREAGTPGACGLPTATEGSLLPWRSLGLAEAEARDGWGRYLTYAPAETLTAEEALLSISRTDPALTLLVGEGEEPAGPYAFVVVSHGPNGLGAYVEGGRLPLPAATSDEWPNARPDIGIASGFVDRAFLLVPDAPASAEGFDDLLVARSVDELQARIGSGPPPPQSDEFLFVSPPEGGGSGSDGSGGSVGIDTTAAADQDPEFPGLASLADVSIVSALTGAAAQAGDDLVMNFGSNSLGSRNVRFGEAVALEPQQRACAWIDRDFPLSDRKLRLRFSFLLHPGEADPAQNLGTADGFTVAFLPGGTPTGNSLCGSTDEGGHLAYEALKYAAEPSATAIPRLGLEFDIYQGGAPDLLDPPHNHAAALFESHNRHGSGANPACAAPALNGVPAGLAGCTYRDGTQPLPNVTWLEEQTLGQTRPYPVRVELSYDEDVCLPGEMRLKAWIDCNQPGCDNLAADYGGSVLNMVDQCGPEPGGAGTMSSVKLGFTAASGSGGGTMGLQIVDIAIRAAP